MDNVVSFLWISDNDRDTGRTRRMSFRRDRDYRQRRKELEDIANSQVEEIEQLKKRDRASQGKITGLQEDLQTSQAALQVSEGRCRELDDYNQQLKKYSAQLERNVKATEGEKAELERALAQALAERGDLTALLNRGLVELKEETQTHLNGVDDATCSSEVLALVKRINTQIFHTAATISDDFQDSYGTQKYGPIVNMAVAGLKKSNIVGAELPSILSASDHRTDPTLVQIALQGALAMMVFNFASPWFTSLEKQTAFLHSIYVEMCRHELQSVSEQWRTMALTYTRAIIPEKGQSVSVPALMMIDCVTDVLLACGVDGSPEQVRRSVRLHHAERLKQVATQVLDLRCISGGQIVSGDLQVFPIWPPASFDPACMEDEWAEVKRPENTEYPAGNILCTTNLGVIRRERRAKKDEDDGPMREVVLLKPKVVLHRTLRELFLEPNMGMESSTGNSAAVPS